MVQEKKKQKLQPWQILLFVVSGVAVLFTTTSYVRGMMSERAAEAQTANRGGSGGMGGPGGFNPQQMAARRLDEMTTELKLTTDQHDKIKKIQDDMAPQMQAIRNDNSLSRDQRRAKMQPLREQSNSQIKQLLTPEQQTKFDAMEAQRRARFGGMGGNGGPRGMNGGRGGNGGNNGPAASAPTNPPPPSAP